MVLNIIFSFNRAMQLDYFLTSGLERLKFDTETVIIYHTTGEHAKGYAKLIEKFSKYPHIRFEERTPNTLSLYHRLKYSKEQQKEFLKRDNFKQLLEKIMRQSECEFVMFNTDDGFWTDDVNFFEEIQRLIRLNPASVTYRMFVGENLEDFPAYVKKWGDYYLWDYYADEKIVHWTYPFAIDATIYNREYLLSILRKNWYSSPIDLESHIVAKVMQQKIFGIGISPQQAIIKGTVLNRVSQTTANPTINLSVDELNKRFLEGYILKLYFKFPTKYVNLVPEKVELIRENNALIIYEKDDAGENIQNRYGAEGTKSE